MGALPLSGQYVHGFHGYVFQIYDKKNMYLENALRCTQLPSIAVFPSTPCYISWTFPVLLSFSALAPISSPPTHHHHKPHLSDSSQPL